MGEQRRCNSTGINTTNLLLMLKYNIWFYINWKAFQVQMTHSLLSSTADSLRTLPVIILWNNHFPIDFGRKLTVLTIDEHPPNPPFRLTVWCKSMQVNILRDFTEITLHVLQGQHTPEILGFPCLSEGRFFLPPPATWWWKYIPLSGWHGVSYRSYQSFDPAAINNHGA